MSFATRLKKLRELKHVTQQELADYLHVTRPTIAGYETKGKEPSYETMLAIASFFDVSADYLITGKNYPGSLKALESHSLSDMLYEDFLILDSNQQNATATILERIRQMDSSDVARLLDYAELLLYHPKYKDR